MPKCVTPGCDQTAFYGTVFNMPRWCKVHMSAGSGSVRKRCAMFDCSNAVFTAAPECERCGRVVAAIENFRRKSLDDLKSAIDKENGSFLAPPVASARGSSAPMKLQTSSTSLRVSSDTGRSGTSGLFGNPAESGMPLGQPAPKPQTKLQTSSTSPMKLQTSSAPPAASKIVRIPDEAPKPSDLAVAKKRAQTPGRARATHGQDA